MTGVDEQQQAEQRQADLRAAYAQALSALRLGRAETAEKQLRALQAALPGDVNSLRLLGLALLAQDKLAEAVQTLETVIATAPGFWQARVDLARAYRRHGRPQEAHAQLEAVLRASAQPRSPSLPTASLLYLAYLGYGDVLVDLGRHAEARVAFERARLADPHRERIEAATAALLAENRKSAEQLFREILQEDATHVAALCGLAAISLTVGRTNDAERLLRHAEQQSAHLPLLRRGLSHTLLEAGRLTEAEDSLRELLQIEPENPQNWVALGSVYTRFLRQPEALAAFEEAARLNPRKVALRLSIGHLLKTLGRRAECEAAYLECLTMDPTFGEAYWSLADLKTYVFSETQLAAMQELAATQERDAHLQFALGRAFEQRRDFRRAFRHYAAGNAQRRLESPFDMAHFEAKTQRVCRAFTTDFFAERAGAGALEPAPIFIVGLPRSGSTLVEQILASHSRVEGTMELPNILTMVREFDHHGGADAYPESLAAAPREFWRRLGQRYLDETRPIRSGRPHFIDKMPNNFSHVGLIHLILPNATVIDVRRHPMDACFSSFKQHFAEGQSFSYDLDDLGRYYRCYLALMDHWDRVLPGKVLHLHYESLVADPDTQIRRLLDHCGLDFEPGCLNFHATRRPVRTASSEQVRQPLYASGVGHWRNFAEDLVPLRASLGDCLARFAAVDEMPVPKG
jgi:predicted Zn-dependent protease